MCVEDKSQEKLTHRSIEMAMSVRTLAKTKTGRPKKTSEHSQSVRNTDHSHAGAMYSRAFSGMTSAEMSASHVAKFTT